MTIQPSVACCRAVVEKSGFSVLQAGDGDTPTAWRDRAGAASAMHCCCDLIHAGLTQWMFNDLSWPKNPAPKLPVIRSKTAKGSIEALSSAMKGGARGPLWVSQRPRERIVRIHFATLLENENTIREVDAVEKTVRRSHIR